MIKRLKRAYYRWVYLWYQMNAEWRGDYYESVYWSQQRDRLRP